MEPREAARLLAQTQADARRSLDFRAPWVSLVAAVVALASFGIVWLNVRTQHPFTGPSPVRCVKTVEISPATSASMSDPPSSIL